MTLNQSRLAVCQTWVRGCLTLFWSDIHLYAFIPRWSGWYSSVTDQWHWLCFRLDTQTDSQSLQQSCLASVRKGQPLNHCTVMYTEKKRPHLVHIDNKACEYPKDRRVSAFRCYNRPSLDSSTISNRCQGKGKSGREKMVSRGKAGGYVVAEDKGDGCHIANHQTKQWDYHQ